MGIALGLDDGDGLGEGYEEAGTNAEGFDVALADAPGEERAGLAGDGGGGADWYEVDGEVCGFDGGEGIGDGGGVGAAVEVGVGAEGFAGETGHVQWWAISKKKGSVEKIVLTVVKKRCVMG